ncbi:2-oxo-4-hydroxy-4-carboxy-5-ureidoimidazoline decarboxylase [Psychrobacter pygoscelis]|uniref:2-oxo-4-hydroxy-4-carboxy-5-ureidoimidazoline decarboxylase n=1 Tax=Psychrobacter pygoscelis TaxID=2488563 RepID=UPI0010397768|nr:2-oxo-4-hydroxy-4-carboxy-5-ureidoimidazoline decarboxylase [Psychrobacter pygoscelis]
MTLSLTSFNQLPEDAATNELLMCCTSERWATMLVEKRPFASLEALITASDAVWSKMGEADYLQAFEGHPQIGDVSTLKEKYRHTAGSAAHEQSGANEADDSTLHALAKGNQDYLEKFGFIFIVFATGKSAQQMLDLLNARLPNDREQELANAAAEQNKITQLRLSKLIEA